MNEEYIEIITEIEEENFTSPERILFLSVIFQALLDATKEKTKVESSRTSVERAHARAWFFCSVGVTCDNFEYVCENAGMDSHYKDCAIQPVDYIVENNLDFLEGNVVKYITRHRTKGGIEDIKKVIHYAELILEKKYGKDF